MYSQTWNKQLAAVPDRSGLALLAAPADNWKQDLPSVHRKGKSLTRERSFPVAIAIADSKHPVVEKVQQLPQGPCIRNQRGTAP